MSTRTRGSRPRAWLLAALVVAAGAPMALWATAAAATATPAPVTYGSANVDGNPTEWGSPPPTASAIPMYEAGDPSKANPSNAYLRYSCSTKTMYVLVQGNAGFSLVDSAGDAWATLDSVKKRYTGASGDDGTPPDFQWIPGSPPQELTIDGVTRSVVGGYEASLPLDPGSYSDLVIHAQFAKGVVDGSGTGGTSANVGFRDSFGTTSLTLDCTGHTEDPSISVVKSTNGDDANSETGPYVKAGGTVSWTYLVTNTGDVPLSGVTVTDSDPDVTVDCPSSDLAVGAQMTCTATGTALVGQYANTATATGTSPGGTTVQATDPSHYFGLVDLDASATAAASFDRTYGWAITKDVDKTIIKQVGGTATFTYGVTVEQSGYTDGNWAVSGKITLSNPDPVAVSGITVTDTVDNGGTCAVTDGAGIDLAAGGSKELDYACSWASAPSPTDGTNTASVTWTGPLAGSTTATAKFAFGTPATEVNKMVHVTDTYANALGTLSATTSAPWAKGQFSYARTVSMPAFGCDTYDNTASITETGQSASRSVKACGPVRTGALTMGFWQNKNGQDIIATSPSAAGVCNAGTWLQAYAPFRDLSSTASCATVAKYVTNVVKAASAAGSSMNAMLKGQMLATALDVYFSDPALGGNRIGAPAPIGGVQVDLSKVCTDLSCTAYEDSSAQFGGSPRTVLQMLAYAAGQSSSGGGTWYANAKSVQELAKDAFDALNNSKAFGA